MNTEIIVHPKLQHFGLATANLDAMLDWYRKVLGMTVNYRAAGRLDHRTRFRPHSPATLRSIIASHSLQCLASSSIPDKPRHTRVQHVAFEYETLDELLGT